MPKTKVSKERPNARPSNSQSDGSVSLILPYLFIGPCSATSASSTFIPRHGITHVISVGKKPVSTLDKIAYLRLSIEDDPSAPLAKAGEEAAVFIDKAMRRRAPSGKKSSSSEPAKIFVHCSAGISRSPAIVAFYLMRSCDMSLKRALGSIIRARPQACPNPGFLLQLQQAELGFRGCASLSEMPSLPIKKEERLALFHEDPSVEEAAGSPLPASVPCEIMSGSGNDKGDKAIPMDNGDRD